MTVPSWKSTVAQKRQAQLASIPQAWRLSSAALETASLNTNETVRNSGILSADELEWTEIVDIQILLTKLASREISSVQLTTAFSKRAAIAQQTTKCLTEIFFDRALARARELDEVLERTGKVTGPLHGLPVSVKDRFEVEGVDTTVGMDIPILVGVWSGWTAYIL